MNQITVIGNVGRDPELKYTPSSMAVLKFSVADTRGKDEKKHTSWHDIVVFGDQAESVVNQIGKGNRVIVTGRLQIDVYDKKDGTKGKRVEIVADEIGMSLRYPASDAVSKIAGQFGGDTVIEEDLF
jgi:single-strand DNA-binding protein